MARRDLTFAHRFPERVSHLILLNPFAHVSYNVERSDRFRWLCGDGGSDNLQGGDGNDLLNGGAGNDAI